MSEPRVHRLATLNGGELRLNASRDGRALMLGIYGARGGLLAGADIPAESIPALVAAVEAIDGEALGLLFGVSAALYVSGDVRNPTAVPELGTH